MTQRLTRHGWLGLMLGIAWGLPVVPTAAQQAPPPNPATAAPKPATTQPAAHPESQEALEKLLKMRDEMQRQQQEKEKSGQSVAPSAAPEEKRESSGKLKRPGRRTVAGQGATPQNSPPPAEASEPAGGQGAKLEELQKRARASTQKATPPGAAPNEEPVAPPPGDQRIEDASIPPPEMPQPAATPAPTEELIGPPLELANNPDAGRATGQPSAAPALPQSTPPAAAAEPPPAPRKRRADAAVEDGEWFNFKDTPWEDVIRIFAERLGKPLLETGDLVISGELTYVNERKFTKDEALDELNLLMALHAPQGYRFVEDEYHIRVIPLNEMPWWVPVKYTFDSVEAFEAANPRDMDFVVVYYQVKDRPAQAYVSMFFNALPDPTQLTALAESNQLKIVALARDVRRFMQLKDKVKFEPSDPREMRIFDIKTNALDIEQRVRSFLGIGGGSQPQAPRLVKDPRTGQMIPQAAPAPQPAAESDVLMVADERTNSIIVKATPEKVKDIKDLIETLDQKPDIGEFKTEVIKILHADATQVATLLNQIFTQEQGQTQAGVPNWQQQQALLQMQQARMRQQPGRPGQPQPPQPMQMPIQVGAAPENIITEGIFERAKKTIRLVADSRMNALIVYANAEGLGRVREMLEVLDRSQPDNLQTFKLEYAKVSELSPLLAQLVGEVAQSTAVGGRNTASVVPDEVNNLFYVIAERDLMDRVAELIRQLDVPSAGRQRHLVELKHLRPSDVAQLVQTLLTSGSTVRRMTPGGGGGIRGKMPGAPVMSAPPASGGTTAETYQVIALDEAQVLIVFCADKDWEKIEQTIAMWDDRALTNTPHLETFQITQGNANTIATTLQGFYRTYQHPVLGASPVTIQPDGDKILVYAIDPAIDEIGALIVSMDVESITDKIEILPLVNADASQVATQAQALFAKLGPKGAAAGGPMIVAEAVTNSLLVQGDKLDVEKIKSFAMQMDQRIGAQATEQRFYTLKYAGPGDIATAIQTIFGQAKGGGKAGVAASQIRAMAAGAQVMVEAPKDKFAAIEAFIKQMDDPKGNELVVKSVKVPGADVTAVAQMLRDTIGGVARPGTVKSTFLPDPSSESIIVSAPVDLWPKIDELVATFTESSEDLRLERRFYPIAIADASYVADLLTKQLPAQVQQTKGQNIASRITISVDARQNQVIVYAPKLVHALADEMIKTLDREDTSELAPVTLALSHADPNQMATTINQVFGATGGQARQGQSKQQEVQALVSNGLLVVKATKKKLEDVKKLVADLDAPDKLGLQVKTYTLKVLNAVQVAVQVQTYLRSVMPAQRSGQMQPGAFGEPSTNTLVVIAPAENLPFIDSLVTQFESAERPESGAKTYVLKNARADQIAQNLDQMLKAKVAEREGDVRKGRVFTSVMADGAGNRLFVFAPEDYQKLAAELIRMVDEEVVAGDIVHIIPLDNADAQQVATSLGQVITGNRTGSGTPGARSGTATVRVSADAGSNSILLAGMPKDLAEVENWLKDLDINSVRVPELQVFRIAYTTPKKVETTLKGMFGGAKNPQDAVSVSTDEYSGEVVVTANKRKMRQVEATIKQLDAAPSTEQENELPGGRQLNFVDVYRGKATDIAWSVRDLMPSEKDGGPSIESDWFDEYLIVKCRPSEFPRIEKLIHEFDARAKVESKVVVRKPRGDAARLIEYIQAREGDKVVVDQPTSEKPKFQTLVVDVWPEGEEPQAVKDKHERDSREKNGQDKSDKPRSEKRILPFQSGLPLSELLLDDIEQELNGQSDAKVHAALSTEKPAPRSPWKFAPRWLPRASVITRPAVFTAQAASLGLRAGPTPRQASEARTEPPKPLPVAAPQAKPVVAQEQKAATTPPESSKERHVSSGSQLPILPQERKREPAHITVQPDGTVVITGPKDGVSDVEKSMDLLEEDLTVGEVIRIFRFKYGDVTAAAEVLSLMFDVQQRQIVIQQPQQQQQQRQQGKPGEEAKPGQGGMMEQLRSMVGGSKQEEAGKKGAGGRMRIVPDPGHNYLIVKCDEADLSDIMQLLRELDIPPGEVEIHIFQLKNLQAEETAQNISDVLGISKVQQRRGGRLPQQSQQRPGMPGQPQQQQQLIEMLQQQLVSAPGVEGGAKVERVEIVPNAVTNSLLVSAPPEVMKLIEGVIKDLEKLEGRDVVGIHYYTLKHAHVDDILPLLQETFAAAAGGGSSGMGGGFGGGMNFPGMQRMSRGMSSGSSPAALGPVTISGDPRGDNRTIIYTAQTKDVETVETHIRALDIEGAVAEAELYICHNGDAESIAAAVEAVFASGGTAGRLSMGGPRGGASTTGTNDVRIVADAATNSILVWAPASKRALVREKIEALDTLAQQGIREIPVRFADPEKLASTLSDVFATGGTGAAGGGRSGARRARPGGAGGMPGGGAAVTNTGRIMIMGDKPAKKLLVRAPNEIYSQIEELVATLDQPNMQMQLKRFPLKHAQAAAVVDSVEQAMTKYIQLAKTTGTDTDFDAFTAVPDERTNSVVVLGSDKTFLFVQQVLAAVDVETPADQQKEFRVFMLEKADAVAVADAINSFATGGAGATGGKSGARRTGGGTPSGAGGGPRELNVYAVAEEPTNSVMVFGRAEDIDVVEEMVIAKVEDSIADRTRIETIAVNNVPPSQIVSFISMFMGEMTSAAGGGQQGRRPKTEQQAGPQIVPNDSAKTLVVRGTKRQIAEVRDLVERFDDQDIVQATIKVIEIPYGQDAMRLAQDIEQILNANEQDLADRTGRMPRKVVIRGDQYTNAVIVAGDPALFGQAEAIVKQLGEVRSGEAVTRVIELKNLSAQDAEQVINELQRKGSSGGRSGAVRPAGGSSGGGGARPSSPRPSGGSSGRPSGGAVSPPRPPAMPPSAPPSGGPPKPPAPSGGGKKGALLPQPAHEPLMVRPVAWAAPYVAATPLAPVVALLLGEQLLNDEPPREGAAPAEPPALRKAPATQPAQPPTARNAALQEIEKELAGKAKTKADEKPAGQPAPSEEAEPETEVATPITEGLSGVTGALRGEVTAKAVDSQRIIITGDKQDVEFIERILGMMEDTTYPATIQVFPLKKSKATALREIIDKSVKAWIDARTRTPGPQDKFSVNAENRSNSLIVSASPSLMKEISELVTELDKEMPVTAVRTHVLSNIRAAEAVAILKPTVEKLNKMRDVPTESQASIEAIDRANSVMIMGTEADGEEIEKWLEAVDVEITSDVQKKSFVRADAILIQLKNGSAEDVAKVINDMIKAEQEATAQSGGDKKSAGKPIVKTIKLHMSDGTELPELQLEYPIRLVPEKGTNSLIIFSTIENNEALRAIVGVFDTLPIGADTDVKAFALRYAAAEDVSKLMTDIFKDKSYLNRPSEGDAKGLQKGVLPPVPPGMAAKGLPYPLVVQHDARSNTVVVIGRKDAVLLAGGLISELDRPSVELGLKPNVLPLKSAQASQMTEKLKKMWEDRAKAVHGDKNAARDSAIFYADERSNKLIVLASDEVYDMIEDLVLQLDAADKYSVVDVRYHALVHADAVKLKNMLEETFKTKKDAEKAANKDATDTLSLVADTRSNSLLLTGTRDYLDEADRLIAQLDKQFDPTVVFKAHRIKLNSAPNVASLLKEMADKAMTQKDSKLSGSPIYVGADPVSDSLLLAAAKEDMDVLERWVDILDRPSEVGRMTKVIPLSRAIAEDVQKAVQDIFKTKGGGGGGKGGEIDVAVSADKTTNSVIAFGPPALLRDVEDFVKQLDSTEATKSTIVRIFKLEQAAALDAGELLNRILDLRGGSIGGTGGGGGSASGGNTKENAKQVMLVFQHQHPDFGLETLRAMRTEVVVISDMRTNALVVTAPADSMKLMEELVKVVDVPPQDAKIRVFRLRNSDAEQMVKTLGDLFARKNTASSASSTVTGGASGAQIERVLSFGEGGEGGRQEVAFTTDVRTNSVIAAGTPGYLNLAEQTILELDTVPLTDRVTFVYSPRNIKAKSLVPSLKDFSDAEQNRLKDIGKDVSIGAKQERQIVAIANEDANRVILSVDPRFQESVMDVVKQLDQPPPQVLIQVLIVEVTMSNSLDLGVEFAFQDLQYAKAGASDTTTFDFVGGTDIGAAGSGLGGFSFTITGADFNFLIRTLQSENNLQVLSRPQIVAQDNQKATLEIGDDVPYVSGTGTTTGGVTSVNVAREKVGIKLEVTPQINPDGFVRMEISQEVSDITGSTVAVGQGVTAPVFFRRNANTTLTVKDNETVVLGGLITSRMENKENKVPLVGDIPGLGLLFRSQNDNTKRTELLLVLTPHVVRTIEEFHELSLVERDATKLLPDEIRTDPLMQGLRMEPEPLPPAEGVGAEPGAPGGGLREHPEANEEEYGPVRPTLHVETTRDEQPDTYDVPLTLRGARR
jgi:type II secretion system protein D